MKNLMQNSHSPFIGVFDSGLGGLTILKQLQKTYPKYNFVYIADTINLPYGEKNEKELLEILINNLNLLKNAQMIIVACNTISSLSDKLDLSVYPPVINIIECLTDTVLQTPPKSVTLLATEFTVNYNKYHRNFQTKLPNMIFNAVAGKRLVPAIESESDNLSEILEEYLNEVNTEQLILGCTHYNLLYDKITLMRPELVITDPYSAVLLKLKNLPDHEGKTEYYTTKYSSQFHNLAERIMDQTIILQTLLKEYI